MSTLLLILQSLFIAAMLTSLLGFFVILLNTWTWAQNLRPQSSLAEIFSIASVEWGSAYLLFLLHLKRMPSLDESPPSNESRLFNPNTKRQTPIVFIPSFYSGASIFLFHFWNLKKGFHTSLWPFWWKSFLTNPLLLEDQLSSYLRLVQAKTKSQRIQILSFGTSRPTISKVLSHPEFQSLCEKWIAISSPSVLSKTLRFLKTSRLEQIFSDSAKLGLREPDLLLRGDVDSICYPESVFGGGRQIVLKNLGHYGSLLSQEGLQIVREEFS